MNVQLGGNKGRSPMRGLFGGIFSGVAAFMAFVWLTFLIATGLMFWYLSYHLSLAVLIAFAAGWLSCSITWLMFKIMDFLSDSSRDIGVTKRHQADQQGQLAALQAQAILRNTEVAGLSRQTQLERHKINLAQDLMSLEPEADPVTIDGDLFSD